jgi:hypothetical protein
MQKQLLEKSSPNREMIKALVQTEQGIQKTMFILKKG